MCYTGATPLLRQLISLKVAGGRKLKIIDRVAANWQTLALVGLKLPHHVVKNIESCTAYMKPEVCCCEAFRRWLEGEGEGDHPITWETIVVALIDAEKAKLASELEQILN